MIDTGYRGYHSDLQNAPNKPEPAVDSWSCAGNLTTGAGSENREVGLQQIFPVSGDYTILFDLIRNHAFTGALRCEALITWTVAGNNVTRRVIVANGTSITGTAKGVTISMKNVGNETGTVIPYRVSALVTPGTRGTFQNPPTLPAIEGVVGIAAGATATFLIPDDCGASSFKVLVGSTAGAVIPDQGIQAIQQDPSGGTLAQNDPRDGIWQPLEPGCVKITLKNWMAGTAVNAVVVFGIDG